MKKALVLIFVMLLTLGALYLYRESPNGIIVDIPSLMKPANSTQLSGRVVSIADGDTITILDSNNHQNKIRLAEIDAPEKKQAFGTKAKEALADKVFDKNIVVKWKNKDRYGRIVGNVYFEDRHINREMVEEGWAWHYTTYSKSKEFADYQTHAKTNKLGLWKDASPTPPWDFRKKK